MSQWMLPWVIVWSLRLADYYEQRMERNKVATSSFTKNQIISSNKGNNNHFVPTSSYCSQELSAQRHYSMNSVLEQGAAYELLMKSKCRRQANDFSHKNRGTLLSVSSGGGAHVSRCRMMEWRLLTVFCAN